MMQLSEFIKKTKKAKKVNKSDIILEYCRDKNVLDIGCVGQDLSLENPLWMHNRIIKVAKQTTGVDIDDDGIRRMQEKGFRIYNAETLKGLKEKYEVLVMGDVIEHTNSPVEFLNFYSQFLTEDGSIIVTTPNFISARTILTNLFFNFHSVNSEHTCWFCTKTFFEVCRRSNFTIQNFYWLNPIYTIKGFKIKMRIIRFLAAFLTILRRSFSEGMLFIIYKEKHEG